MVVGHHNVRNCIRGSEHSEGWEPLRQRVVQRKVVPGDKASCRCELALVPHHA